MAYDAGLAERIRAALEDERGVTEKKMFGGVAFLLDGKMFCGLATDDLMVRVGPERYAEALKRPHARPMDFTGKPMTGYVFVAPAGLDDDEALADWVRLGLQFTATLPAKSKSKSKSKPKSKQAKSKKAKSKP
jgi:TfoX/Sxy family transcriptional regulator of competence genes